MSSKKNKKTLGSTIIVIVAVSALAVGALGAVVLTKLFGDKDVLFANYIDDNKEELNSDISNTFSDIKEDADNYKVESNSRAFRLTANRKTAQSLESLKSDKEKLQMAANIYAGFYARQTLGVSEYCSQFKVDLSPYIQTFKSYNSKISSVAENCMQLLTKSNMFTDLCMTSLSRLYRVKWKN